jgi:tripartite-type tricarboxylate transporter receptor subunit TctC
MRSVVAALLAAIAFSAGAQPYPSKPVKIIAAFPPGGAPDIFARLIAENLGASLGQQVIVENRTGAGGNIASEAAARSAPDGYTLYLAAHPPFTLNPLLFAKAPYDAVKDFAPIAMLGTQWFVLVVNPAVVPAKTVQELIAYAKANPGKLSYGSSGIGSPHHLGMEYLKVALGLDIVHVPYKGASLVIPDLVNGAIPVALSALTVAGAQLKAGKLIPLALTSKQRSASLPGVPTIAETVVPGYEVTAWFALVAPAGTPKDIITRVNAEAVRTLQKPEVVSRLGAMGLEPQTSTPEGLGDIIRSEIERWERVIKEGKLKAQ